VSCVELDNSNGGGIDGTAFFNDDLNLYDLLVCCRFRLGTTLSFENPGENVIEEEPPTAAADDAGKPVVDELGDIVCSELLKFSSW
jgi:hypothetical protein